MSNAAVADEGGGDADEGREVLGFAFVASVQAADAVRRAMVRSTV
ncbi:hypothetical protein [Actinomadura keratinilytica]|uniref:Uncharacterized protein n=1 Tax=Actinomadura keratinilytica TaxID=547461 RepID=A0ABP7Z612_9ACTN